MNTSNTSTEPLATQIGNLIFQINAYNDTLCSPFLILNGLIGFFLSFIWSAYIIIQLIRDHQYIKKLKKRIILRPEEELHMQKICLKSKKNFRVKRLLFLGICLSECGLCFMLGMYSAAIYRMFDNQYHHDFFKRAHISFLAHFNTKLWTMYALKSFGVRIFGLLVAFSIYTNITLVRILTEFMCSVYDYFKINPYVFPKLLFSFVTVSVIILVGLFRQLMIFGQLAFCVALFYQLILFFIAMRRLKKLLFKRLFDSRTHESGNPYQISFFKNCYFEFKIASLIILVALFFYILSFSLMFIHPIIMMISHRPDKWLNVVLYDQEPKITYTSTENIYSCLISAIIQSFLTLGSTLQVLPYLLISLRLLCSNIKNKFKNPQKLYNREWTKAAIKWHNKSYINSNDPRDKLDQMRHFS